jgi:hypothetical protein
MAVVPQIVPIPRLRCLFRDREMIPAKGPDWCLVWPGFLLPVFLRAAGGLLLAAGPLRVFLRDQALDPLGQLLVPVRPQIRPCLGKVQVAFVFEGLSSGPVGDPALLELVEVLG